MRLPHFVAATLLLVASAARADEAPPPAPAPSAPVVPVPPPEPPAVEEVARLIGSAVAAERERGEVLLVRALRTVPDRAAFLEQLAASLRTPATQGGAGGTPQATQAPPAPAPAPLDDANAPSQERAEVQVEALPQGGGAAKAPAAKAVKPATWTLKAWGISVPAKEVVALKLDGGGSVESENEGLMDASGLVENASAWAEAAGRAADAVPLGEATLALPDDEPQSAHLGANLVYRCCAVESKGGAWRVETGTIDTGLSLRATKTKTGLIVEPVWVTVAQPISTEATRPAPGVALELDRPDWSAARTRHVLTLGKDRGAGFLAIPGILPDADRRLVIVLELKPR